MGLFKCRHDWRVHRKSNVLQMDCMGMPLRLYSIICVKCGELTQEWVDVHESVLKELETGESVLLKWT